MGSSPTGDSTHERLRHRRDRHQRHRDLHDAATYAAATGRAAPPAAPAPPASGMRKFNEGFRRVASASANAVGAKWAFLLSVLGVVVWGGTGAMFPFSDTWQLVINTGTTIVTFLMVFLIQNTQNRDAKAIHLKLDELIRGVKGARNGLVNLEELTDDELAALQRQFERVRKDAAKKLTQHAEHIEERADDAHRVASE